MMHDNVPYALTVRSRIHIFLSTKCEFNGSHYILCKDKGTILVPYDTNPSFSLFFETLIIIRGTRYNIHVLIHVSKRVLF